MNDIVKVGDIVQSKLLEIDAQKRLNFSLLLDDPIVTRERREMRTEPRGGFSKK